MKKNKNKNKGGKTYKPDMIVAEIGNEQYNEEGKLTNPFMVSEIFASNEEAEYEQKLLDYQRIPSLKICFYIWEDKIQVDLHWRDGAEWKKQRYQSLDDMIKLPPLDAEMAVASIYAGVSFNKKNKE